MKKSLALVLSLLLILGVFPVMALASATLQGSGTSDEPYQIGDYAQLKEFADLVNGGQTGAYAVLTNDITATGTWTPICPDNEAAYKGVFDGQGHTITGLTVETGNAFTGLFGCVKGVVQNLTLKDSTIQGEGCVGAIAGEVIYGGVHNCHNVGTSVTGSSAYDGGIVGLNNGYVSDCTNSGGVTGESFVGGIAGLSSTSLSSCTNNGTVAATDGLVGGIAGQNSGTVEDCTNNGELSAHGMIGGIVGENSESFARIKRCVNTGKIMPTGNTSEPVGGIAGKNNGTVESCRNSGEIAESSRMNIGGIVGDNTGRVQRSYNTGKVTGRNYVGGLVGYNSDAISDSFNTGAVNGKRNVGGVAGYCLGSRATLLRCHNDGSVTNSNGTVGGVVGALNVGSVDLCYNTGTVTGGGGEIGGVVGYNHGTLSRSYNTGKVADKESGSNVGGLVGISDKTIRDCFNTGDVSGNCYVGGLVGENDGDLTNCYVAAKVTGTVNIGAVYGKTYDHTVRVAYNEDLISDPGYIEGGAGHSLKPEPYTTAQMTGLTTNVYYKWTDFDANWVLTEGYPQLAALTHSFPGSGTPDDPYRLADYADLKNFAALVNSGELAAYTVLSRDIVCKNDPADKAYATDWTPIAADPDDQYDKDAYFTGTFDGQGHIITGLSTPTDNAGYGVGLFGIVESIGVVKDVHLREGNIQGTRDVGGIAGYCDGTVSHCTSTNIVYGSSMIVGGIVGRLNGRVENCTHAGRATSDGTVGGIVGSNAVGTVIQCTNNGEVLGNAEAGGIVGRNDDVITQCRNTGRVAGKTTGCSDKLGGIAGESTGSVTYCGNLADVAGETDGTGGIAGSASGVVAYCFSAGRVTFQGLLGNPIVGRRLSGVGTPSDCTFEYNGYDWQVQGTSAPSGTPEASDPAAPRSTKEMTGLNATAYQGWADFDKYWVLTDGYPQLKAMVPSYKGSGTEKDPYQLASYADLKEFAWRVNIGEMKVCAALTQDIVCQKSGAKSGYATDWTPIGNDTTPFRGTFDGKEHTITGLSTPTGSNGNDVGLFGAAVGGVLQNVHLKDGAITGCENVGSVVGLGNGTTVKNCSNSGTVTGEGAVGGIVGWIVDGQVEDCANTGAVSGGNGYTGGVAGKNRNSTVTRCVNSGAVTGTSGYTGGVVGVNEGALTQSYNTADVSGLNYVGGVAGENSDGSVTNCYNTGDVTGEYGPTGGVVGSCTDRMDQCFNAGSVTSSNTCGGVIGDAGYNGYAPIANCCFDWERMYSTQPAASGNYNVPRSTAQMTGLNATAYQDWEGFDTYWVKTASFPRLKAFLVTVSATAQTGGSVSGAGSYDKDDTVTLMATPNTGYHFVCWQEDGDTVSADANYSFTATIDRTLTAVFQINTYEITFKNEDGTVLQSGSVEYGKTPSYTGATPTKAANAQYTYTFAGWDTTPSKVTGTATYTATFNKTVNKYEIIFKNEDGTVLQSGPVEYGETPSYTGAAPTKAADENYTYEFAAWDPAIDNVTGEATYNATFTEKLRMYTVTFKNGDEVLQTVEIAYGETPVYSGPTPTKEADAQYTYTFAGWDTALSAVTGETTYTAAFTATASPKTGDHRQPGLWLALLALSGFALAGSILVSRKRRRA